MEKAWPLTSIRSQGVVGNVFRMRCGSLYELKPRFVGRLEPVVESLARRRFSPTAVTLAALPVSASAAAALIAGRSHPILWVTVPVFAAALIAINAIDGHLARVSGDTSHAGAALNELVDRLSDVFLVGSAYFLVSPGLASSALILVVIVEVVALIGLTSTGDRSLVGVMGKPDRALLISAGAVAAFFVGKVAFNFLFVVLVVGLISTLVQRVGHVLKQARSLDLETTRDH